MREIPPLTKNKTLCHPLSEVELRAVFVFVRDFPAGTAKPLYQLGRLLRENPLVQVINKILLIIANTGHIAHFHSVFRGIRAFMQPIAAKF